MGKPLVRFWRGAGDQPGYGRDIVAPPRKQVVTEKTNFFLQSRKAPVYSNKEMFSIKVRAIAKQKIKLGEIGKTMLLFMHILGRCLCWVPDEYDFILFCVLKMYWKIFICEIGIYINWNCSVLSRFRQNSIYISACWNRRHIGPGRTGCLLLTAQSLKKDMFMDYGVLWGIWHAMSPQNL